MIPAALLGQLPATLSEIAQFAGRGSWLAFTLDKLPNPIEFVARVYKHFPGTPRADAWTMYRVAKFFRSQGDYLAKFGAEDVPDPRLAAQAWVSPRHFVEETPIRYTVEIQTRSPASHRQKTYTIQVYATPYDTVADVQALAAEVLRGRLEGRYKVTISSNMQNNWKTEARISFMVLTRERPRNVRVPA